MFTNKFKSIVNKVSSVSNHFQDIFLIEKEKSKALHKIEHEIKVNVKVSVMVKKLCINAKYVTFQKKIKTFSQISGLKSKINQIWSSLKENPSITTDLEKFINELKTDFGFTQDDFNNMSINNDIVYWLSLITNNVENNDPREKVRKITIKNLLNKNHLLPWDPRLKKVELPTFSPPNDSIDTLQDVLQKLEQFQKKVRKAAVKLTDYERLHCDSKLALVDLKRVDTLSPECTALKPTIRDVNKFHAESEKLSSVQEQ